MSLNLRPLYEWAEERLMNDEYASFMEFMQREYGLHMNTEISSECFEAYKNDFAKHN
jgi:hypothetical protein